jgi:hypothetical protein
MIIHNLEDLIGMDCTHNFGENIDLWSDETLVRCRILGIIANIEEKGFYELTISFLISPIEEKGLGDDKINDMRIDGVCVESLMFD